MFREVVGIGLFISRWLVPGGLVFDRLPHGYDFTDDDNAGMGELVAAGQDGKLRSGACLSGEDFRMRTYPVRVKERRVDVGFTAE
jgi:hypothetical protein